MEVGPRAGDDIRGYFRAVLFCQLPLREGGQAIGERYKVEISRSVVIHDNSHTRHTQPIRLGHHPLPKTIRDVVRAQQTRGDDDDVHGDDGEHRQIPLLQHPPLKRQVVKLTPPQHTARITRLAHSRLDERAEISTAAQLVLDP